MKSIDTRSLVHPSREPGISEQPVIHEAAEDWTFTLDAVRGTAARMLETCANIWLPLAME